MKELFGVRTKLSYKKMILQKLVSIKLKKKKRKEKKRLKQKNKKLFMNKPVYLGLSILHTRKNNVRTLV